MSTGIPQIINYDKRQLALSDAASQRAIAMRNLDNMEQLYAPQWKAKQKLLYNNALFITPDINLGTLIDGTIQNSFDDPQVLEGALYKKLLSIAKPEFAQLIINALTNEEKQYLFGIFDKYIADLLKNRQSVMNWKQLVADIKRASAAYPAYVPMSNSGNVPPLGYGGDDFGGGGGGDGGDGGDGGGGGGNESKRSPSTSSIVSNLHQTPPKSINPYAFASPAVNIQSAGFTAQDYDDVESGLPSSRQVHSDQLTASINRAQREVEMNATSNPYAYNAPNLSAGSTPTPYAAARKVAFAPSPEELADRRRSLDSAVERGRAAIARADESSNRTPDNVTNNRKSREAKVKVDYAAANKAGLGEDSYGGNKGRGLVQWKKLHSGTITADFEQFKKTHPNCTDLEEYANYVISHTDDFSDTTEKRARFYLNVIMKWKGKPMKKTRYGRGATMRPSTNRQYLGKYYVDKNKLSDNILCVKYAVNDAQIPTMKVQRVSSGVKENVEDILNGRFDRRIYNLLSADDKRVVKRFAKTVKMDLDLDDNEDFQRQYEILLGEYTSGNDSPKLKAQLKKFVLEALQENRIPRNQAMMLLYQLSL